MSYCVTPSSYAHRILNKIILRKFLSQYEIKTIPAIRLVDSTGSVVSDNIRIQIENCDTGDVSKLLSEWKNVSND